MGAPHPSAADAVRSLVAVQSQDYLGGTWALSQRAGGATQAAIDDAFDAGAFVRTHVLRPTWHFVAPEDLRWLLAVNGQRRIRQADHRHRALEIDRVLAMRALQVFERSIAAAGPMTRPELGAALAEQGIVADGGRLAHLVMWAEAEGLLCSGPRRSLHTYTLVDQLIPPTPARTPEEALAELAGRYVASHGPAQDVDLAWWGGLTLGEARRGLAAASPALRRETLDGRIFWIADAPSAARAARPAVAQAQDRRIHLLPNYDETLVAFRDRRDGVHPDLPEWARTAEEIFSHVIVRDGLVVGRWFRPAGKGPLKLTMEPRVPLAAEDREGILAEGRRYAAFAGREVEVAGLD